MASPLSRISQNRFRGKGNVLSRKSEAVSRKAVIAVIAYVTITNKITTQKNLSIAHMAFDPFSKTLMPLLRRLNTTSKPKGQGAHDQTQRRKNE